MNEDTRIILEELKGMRCDMREMKTDISELKNDVSQLKNDVENLKNDMVTVKLKIENEIQPAIRVLSENHLSLHNKIV